MPSPSPSPSLRAVIYARVSTEAQAREDRASIPAQLEAARRIAGKRGWPLVREPYVDAGISGQKFEEREALQQMLADADSRLFDLILVYDNDRISRRGLVGALVYDRLDRAGVQIYSINQPIEPHASEGYRPEEDDTILINRSISNLSSELFIRGFRRRSRLGLESRVKEGYMVKVPYGYQVVHERSPAGVVRKLRQPHPQQAPFVQRIFAEYRQGKGMMTIARGLNAEGIPAPWGGRFWGSSTINIILTNPVYHGALLYGVTRVRQGRQVRQKPSEWLRAEGKHPPLISRELFDEVQAIRQRKARRRRASGSPHLLAGLVRCGYCGYAMVRSGSTRGGYYICGRYHKSRECRRNGHFVKERLEPLVLDQLRELRRDPEVLERMRKQGRRQQDRHLDRELAAQVGLLEEIPVRRERLLVAYERGVLTVEEMEGRKMALAEEERRLRRVVARLEADRRRRQQRRRDYDAARQALADFDERFQQLARPQQQQILQSLIERVVIRGEQVHIEYRLGQ